MSRNVLEMSTKNPRLFWNFLENSKIFPENSSGLRLYPGNTNLNDSSNGKLDLVPII